MPSHTLFLSTLVPLVASFLYLNWNYLAAFVQPYFIMGQSPSQTRTYCPPPGSSLQPPYQDPINLSLSRLPDGTDFAALATKSTWYSNTTFAIQASIGGTTVFRHASQRTADQVVKEAADQLFEKQFRIASVTKVFTVLAVLLSRDLIGWDESITKFVPELDSAAYQNVTIGALAGQTSGLGRYGFVGDLSVVPTFQPSQLGLDPVNSTLPGCDPFPGGRICTPEEVLSMFNNPVYQPSSPDSAPLYSNIAYNLLGMALETVHSKPYSEIIKEHIFDPLGMTRSGFQTPNDTDNAVLPQKGESWFAAPFGNYNPSGGIWSTPNDLFRFTQALLNSELLTPAQTRAWLQPHAILPSLHQLVGAPWEIIRPNDLEIKNARPIDIYTKAGGVTGYTSYTILIPEYDIAIAMTTAGNDVNTAIKELLPAVVRPLVKYADAQARLQAQAKYTGSYTIPNQKTEMALTLDDGPGLTISTFVVNGVNVLATLAAVQGIKSQTPSARLYPTDVDSLGTDKERWSILFDREMSVSRGFAELECGSWNWGDAARYVGAPLDSVVFDVRDGKVVGVELVGWRKSLQKVA